MSSNVSRCAPNKRRKSRENLWNFSGNVMSTVELMNIHVLWNQNDFEDYVGVCEMLTRQMEILPFWKGWKYSFHLYTHKAWLLSNLPRTENLISAYLLSELYMCAWVYIHSVDDDEAGICGDFWLKKDITKGLFIFVTHFSSRSHIHSSLTIWGCLAIT